MSKNKKKNDITEKVMQKIHQDNIKMRPRIYFVLGSFLAGVGLGGFILAAIFFINLVTFRLRVQGPFGYLWFGRLGMKPFLITFPWITLLLALGGMVAGILLLRRYEFSYKKSFLGLAIGLVSMVLTFGFFLDKFGLNERIQDFSHIRPFYQSQFLGNNWVVGEITQVEDKRLLLVTPTRKEVAVVWNKGTLLPFGSDFKVGDRIRVIGEWRKDTFVARGIARGGLRWRKPQGFKYEEEFFKNEVKMPPLWY